MKTPKIPFVKPLLRAAGPALGAVAGGVGAAGLALTAPSLLQSGLEIADGVVPALGTRRMQKIVNAKVAASQARAIPEFLDEMDIFADNDLVEGLSQVPRYSNEGASAHRMVQEQQLMSQLAANHQKELAQVAARLQPDQVGPMISRIMQGFDPRDLV